MENTNNQYPTPYYYESKVFRDERGSFTVPYSILDQREMGVAQINLVTRKYGVICGLHYQLPPHAQAKLIMAPKGKIFDVSVDIRKESPTYGQIYAKILTGSACLYIPRGYAHGYSVLSKDAIIQYCCDNLYEPSAERGFSCFSPDLAIDWQIPEESRIIMSDKDKVYEPFARKCVSARTA